MLAISEARNQCLTIRLFRLQTLDFRLQTSDFRLQTSDFGLQTSDFGLQTSDFGLQTSDFKHWFRASLKANIASAKLANI